MRINADFSKLAVVIPREEDWVCSPQSGVDRLMLDRIGDEVARATSIVRYARGSSFSRHEHAKGEEYLVLDGVFSDENGDYPRGTYVRNPPGSAHAPYSADGCRILVKLRQFDPADLAHVVIDTRAAEGWLPAGKAAVRTLLLHEHGNEQVRMLRIAAGGSYTLNAGAGGAELLVISGSVSLAGRALTKECWLRLPAGAHSQLLANEDSLAWMKTGHLSPAPD